ncbi:hypothetical protein DFQ27_008770 [Actinomortierella ambigua]|uniref:Protein kinase domain-containing protein n=1 Tax=Actinomortierella ambigua TaxID=1343610 RepID=A0A9P6PSW6_9FUNG|nr:hypothetical protein DFQ27_008770 [Actinomortierella ambigua]
MGGRQGLVDSHSNIALSYRRRPKYFSQPKPLLTKLGRGTYGTVYKARFVNQLCAAKAFFCNTFDFHLQSIQREISVLNRLRFRHIIQFYRTYVERDRIYHMWLIKAVDQEVLAMQNNLGWQ